MATGGVTSGGRHPAPGAPRSSTQGAPQSSAPPPPGPPPPAPASLPRPAPEEHGSHRTQISVAVISAVATIVAAVVAGVLAVNSGNVHVSLADPSAEVDDLRVTVTSLEREKATLTEENARLEAEAETDGAGASDDDLGDTTVVTSGPEESTSSVRRQTDGVPLTFTWAYSVDLDSVDADWRVEHGTESGWDLYLDGFGNVQTRDVVLFDHVPSEAECRDATVRQTRLEDDQSVVGAMMCVATSEDRYAFVRIAAMDEERETTSVDIVVWE